ncbi:hypothetical protein ACQP3F_34865, partial [Escherichia coli]
KEGRAYSSQSLRVRSIMAEKLQWRELKAAAHITSSVRKQKQMNADAHLNSSFNLIQWNDATHIYEYSVNFS